VTTDKVTLGGSTNDIAGGIDLRNSSDVTKILIDGDNGIDSQLPLIFIPQATSPTLIVNGQVSFERVSNTQLKILMRGTDGTTRSNTLTLS